jgi:hypothetical protein
MGHCFGSLQSRSARLPSILCGSAEAVSTVTGDKLVPEQDETQCEMMNYRDLVFRNFAGECVGSFTALSSGRLLLISGSGVRVSDGPPAFLDYFNRFLARMLS